MTEFLHIAAQLDFLVDFEDEQAATSKMSSLRDADEIADDGELLFEMEMDDGESESEIQEIESRELDNRIKNIETRIEHLRIVREQLRAKLDNAADERSLFGSPDSIARLSDESDSDAFDEYVFRHSGEIVTVGHPSNHRQQIQELDNRIENLGSRIEHIRIDREYLCANFIMCQLANAANNFKRSTEVCSFASLPLSLDTIFESVSELPLHMYSASAVRIGVAV